MERNLMKTTNALARRAATVAGLATALFSFSEARAQLWNPLETKPKPTMNIALDTSVTMAIDINSTCGDGLCHTGSPGTPLPDQRWYRSRDEILITTNVFRDQFYFGAMNYHACVNAQIRWTAAPTLSDLSLSYSSMTSAFNSISECCVRDSGPAVYSKEHAISMYSGCTASVATLPVIDPSMSNQDFWESVGAAASSGPPPIPGFVINPLPVNIDDPMDSGDSYYDPGSQVLTCTSTVGGSMDVRDRAEAEFGTIALTAQSNVTPGSADRVAFCNELDSRINTLRNEWNNCAPDAPWTPSFSCNPSVDVCASGSLVNTCVCEPLELAGCLDATPRANLCGTVGGIYKRQSDAICEFYGGTSGCSEFRNAFAADTLNVAAGGCRQNVGVLFTDAFGGGVPNTLAEAGNIHASGLYRQFDDPANAAAPYPGLHNLYVFRVTDNHVADADQMQQALSNDSSLASFDALDEPQILQSFSSVISRVLRGVYTGTPLTFDETGSRAAFHIFTVPGIDAPGDTYLNWPGRLAWHSVDATGTINPTPLAETDWATRAFETVGGCGPTVLGGADVSILGPAGTFRNGVNRQQTVAMGSVDRDGDLFDDTSSNPNYIPGESFEFGNMLSYGQSRPLILSAPREAPFGPRAADFQNFLTATRTRPRVVYTMSNGFIHGFYAGTYSGTSFGFGGRNFSFNYDDSGPDTGREVLRYKWSTANLDDASTPTQYALNDLLMQKLSVGQLATANLYVGGATGNVNNFMTILAASQGLEGRGYATINVTDPCSPAALAEITLPGSTERASADPVLIDMPDGTGSVPALIVTSGINGGTLYAYNAVTGGLIDSIGLGVSGLPTRPVCLDALGEGVITHCYALAKDGHVLRVELDRTGSAGFAASVDITPTGGNTTLTGRFYLTNLVGFFGADGAVNLAFGSGGEGEPSDPLRLTRNDNGQNYFFKLRDDFTRGGSATAQAQVDNVCNPVSGDQSGRFALPANAKMVSAPVVEKGVVAYTSFVPGNGCSTTQAYVSAFNFETCADLFGTGPRPTAVLLGGDGIPVSPVIHRASETLIAQRSGGATASQVGTAMGLNWTLGGRRPAAKRLYWRLEGAR
jgi:hypothetical protein